MTRTPEQNLDGVMRYLKAAEPLREQFESATRYDIQTLLHRLDESERRIAELEQRIDEMQ